LNRYYSFVIYIFYISFSFINLTADELDLSDKFVELRDSNLDCNSESYDFISSDEELKNYFEVSLDSSVQMGRSILFYYCNKNDDKNFFIENSKEILLDTNSETPQTYLINLAEAFRHSSLIKNRNDLNYQIYNQLLVFQKNINSDLVESESWANILYFMAMYIQLFENSSWLDEYSGSIADHEKRAYSYFSSLEKVVLDNISDKLKTSSLENLAIVLLEIRALKLDLMSNYASLKDINSERQAFLKIYLNNVNEGIIIYREFKNLMGGSLFNNNDYGIIQIELTPDQIFYFSEVLTTQLKTVSSPKAKNLEKYKLTLGEIIIKNFSLDPREAISNLTSLDSLEVNYCPLMNELFLINNEDFEDYIVNSKLEFFKYVCSKDSKYLINSVENISILQSFPDLYNAPDFDFMTPYLSIVGIMNVLINPISEIEPSELKVILDKLLSINYFIGKNIIGEEFGPEAIQIYFALIAEVITDNDIELNNASLSKYTALENLINENRFDPLDLLNQIKNDPDYFSKSNVLENYKILAGISGFIQQNSVGELAGFNEPTTSISENLSQQSTESIEVQNFFNSLELINYLVDYLLKLENLPDKSNQFILNNPSYETWKIFKELITLEGLLSYILINAQHLEFNEYQEKARVRLAQIIQHRPHSLALSKFKKKLISSIDDVELKDSLIKYDRWQRLYGILNEVNMIASGDELSLAGGETQRIKLLYETEIMDAQGIIFDNQNSDAFKALVDFSIGYPPDLMENLQDDEILISFISGSSSSLIYYISNKGLYAFPVNAGIGMLEIYSNIIIEGFSEPNDLINTKSIFQFRDLIFDSLELIDQQNNFKHIYFVGGESVTNIPIHALYLKEGMYAIEKYTFNYLSSEKLLANLETNFISSNQSFIGFGNPTLGKNKLIDSIESLFSKRGKFFINKISDLNPLPETEKELINVSKYFKKSKLFLEGDASESNLTNDEVIEADVIAFATHAVKGANKSFNDRGLVLTPKSKINNYEDDGFLSSFEIKLMNLTSNPAIILTACNTIQSPYFQAEPFSGIAGSFLEAGASGVLLSLWNLDSLSAKEFNESLFQNTGNEKFEIRDSLQASMISMIQSENYWHPHYWAPYVYLGR